MANTFTANGPAYSCSTEASAYPSTTGTSFGIAFTWQTTATTCWDADWAEVSPFQWRFLISSAWDMELEPASDKIADMNAAKKLAHIIDEIIKDHVDISYCIQSVPWSDHANPSPKEMDDDDYEEEAV